MHPMHDATDERCPWVHDAHMCTHSRNAAGEWHYVVAGQMHHGYVYIYKMGVLWLPAAVAMHDCGFAWLTGWLMVVVVCASLHTKATIWK